MEIMKAPPLSVAYFRCVSGVLQPSCHEAVERGRTTEGTPFWLTTEAFVWTVMASLAKGISEVNHAELFIKDL